MRKRIDLGRLPASVAPCRLSETAQRLLRECPGDGPLQQAVTRLAERGFAPPEPTELPQGTPLEMWTALSGRALDEVAALSAVLVTLPDPSRDLPRSIAAQEVLLADPGERERARRLLGTNRDHVDAPTVALWTLRLEGAELATSKSAGDSDRWEDLLSPVREVCSKTPDVLVAALHRAAAGWLEAATPEAGPVPTLGGRRLTLVALTRWRHPDQTDALAPAAAWLEEAAALAPLATSDPLAAALDAMEALDRSGDFDGAGQALGGALEVAGDRADLRAVAEARATLLNVGVDSATQPLARPSLPTPRVDPPAPPGGDWEARITSIFRADQSTAEADDLAYMEAVGLGNPAAMGWLALDTPETLLQAWRLREHLDGAAAIRLTSALQGATPDDDQALAATPQALACGLALHGLLEAGPARRILGVRLGAVYERPPEVEDDDPHSPTHRLEAALDHMAEGRHVGAATAAAALLQRLGDPLLLDRLLDLVVDLLSGETRLEDLARAVTRALEPGGDLRLPLLQRLATTPEAATSVDEALTAIATDPGTPEHEALLALRGVVGHHGTTREPVPETTIRAVIGARRSALMAVAAAMVGEYPDPVSTAREVLMRTPPARSSALSVTREILALAAPETEST